MDNRGIYLIIYTGPGQEDHPKTPGYLWMPTGCCKFGQTQNLEGVYTRYAKHCNNNVTVEIAGRFRDRDDIDLIEKKLHHRFDHQRLKNYNNRKTEWMAPIPVDELKKAFQEVVNEHFQLF
jgi:hypothetical protein